jgi:hypothetical protein
MLTSSLYDNVRREKHMPDSPNVPSYKELASIVEGHIIMNNLLISMRPYNELARDSDHSSTATYADRIAGTHTQNMKSFTNASHVVSAVHPKKGPSNLLEDVHSSARASIGVMGRLLASQAGAMLDYENQGGSLESLNEARLLTFDINGNELSIENIPPAGAYPEMADFDSHPLSILAIAIALKEAGKEVAAGPAAQFIGNTTGGAANLIDRVQGMIDYINDEIGKTPWGEGKSLEELGLGWDRTKTLNDVGKHVGDLRLAQVVTNIMFADDPFKALQDKLSSRKGTEQTEQVYEDWLKTVGETYQDFTIRDPKDAAMVFYASTALPEAFNRGMPEKPTNAILEIRSDMPPRLLAAQDEILEQINNAPDMREVSQVLKRNAAPIRDLKTFNEDHDLSARNTGLEYLAAAIAAQQPDTKAKKNWGGKVDDERDTGVKPPGTPPR